MLNTWRQLTLVSLQMHSGVTNNKKLKNHEENIAYACSEHMSSHDMPIVQIANCMNKQCPISNQPVKVNGQLTQYTIKHFCACLVF